MPPDTDTANLLVLVLTAAGVTPGAAFVTTVVELLKKVIPIGWTATSCRWAAFIGAAVLVGAAYAGTSVEINILTGFAALSAFVSIGRLSVAFYDDATAKTNSITGPVENTVSG